jgi:magnesium transporter
LGFQILDIKIDGTGPPTQSDDTALVAPPPEGTIRWIDLEAQDDATLALLRERFDFHPLAIEDCSHFDQRPKLEEYGSYLFIVTHGFVCPSGDPRHNEAQEVHAFLGPHYLVTVHSEHNLSIELIWKRVLGDGAVMRRGADFLHHQVLDDMVDRNFQLLDLLSDALEDIEDAVLGRAEQRDLAHIFQLKRTLVVMRRVLSPQRDVLAMLAKRGSALISEKTALYYRDVYDHLVRIYESIDAARDLLGNALDAYLSMVAQRTNDIMKRLTILSAVFLPITWVTGFFGQNFPLLVEWMGSPWLLASMLVLCVTIPAVLIYWFHKRNWLS